MTDDELRGMFGELRNHFDAALDGVKDENRVEIEGLRHYVDAALEGVKHETRVEIEGLRHEIQLVAEGVTQTREMLSREATDIRQELRSTTAETHALIRFSYTQLDRRVSKLEETQNQR